MEVILVPTLLAFILFSTSVTLELNVAVYKWVVELDLVANPLTSGFFFLHHLFYFLKY